MIVPMKKVSLLIQGDKKDVTLKTLRKLGLVHIESADVSGEKIDLLNEKLSVIENALFILNDLKNEKTEQKKLSVSKAVECAKEIMRLTDQKKEAFAEALALNASLLKFETWGDIDTDKILALKEKGVDLAIFDIPKAEYFKLGEEIKTVAVSKTKTSVKCVVMKTGTEVEEEIIKTLSPFALELPTEPTEKTKERIKAAEDSAKKADKKISSYAVYFEGMKSAIESLKKELEFATVFEGIQDQNITSKNEKDTTVSHFTGFIEAENLESLKDTAKKNAWGLLIEEPTPDDNVPTKLKNNKFVSLIYPITDFLGTVPGYFEHDISGWFLMFILIFFGIIFGDGGYGLLITAVAAVPIVKALVTNKKVSPMFLLVGLFGLSTVLWGTLTCTWFGLSPESLPQWLKSLSIPVISNVYADRIWYPFGDLTSAGLTTGQNLQIVCFTLALVQLSIAHIIGGVKNRKSIKMLGDIGSILQLVGIYYLVLSLVVNGEVFTFSLVLGGIPIGTLSIALIGIGFLMSFIFSNYEGNLIKSILSSLTNIVSVLLGVVNVFSDIVSYIRLWAVGLAGAAISATVNELAGPLLGNFLFMIFAIILLVFGHGLNMILNVLSVIVHGIRLNTLEFSSHLDMSWSGHKFKPFEE